MNANRDFVALVFSLALAASFWYYCVYYLNPLLRANMDTLDDTIALYVDTLHVIDEGKVVIALPKNIVGSVRIDYETEGRKDGYEIDSDGWYVIVTYQFGGGTIRGASPINTYGEGAPMTSTLFAPESICISKKSDSERVEVIGC